MVINSEKSIYLIGVMGAWKTTVGRLLAKNLGRQFIDTDARLTQLTGIPPSELFKLRGEDYFRDREARLLKGLSGIQNQVVSTGGGIILRKSNRTLMRSTGIVILLYAHPRILAERIKNMKSRPLLSGSPEPEFVLTKLWYERKALYQSTAHFEINTEALTSREVCEAILQLLDLQHDPN